MWSRLVGVSLIILTMNIILAQHVLFDHRYHPDVPPDWEMEHFIDTLESHGVTVHYVTIEGWGNLMNMDMLWVYEYPTYFDVIPEIIEFARNGGKIVLWTVAEPFSHDFNLLLTNSGWQTTMEIQDTFPIPCYNLVFSDFPPITDGIEPFPLYQPPAIFCGEHAYTIAIESVNLQTVAAISYPFRHEGNCSSYVILVTGTSNWESHYIDFPSEYRFGCNILLTAAGAPGYELEPGSIPGGGNACSLRTEEYPCSHLPNPFTPNYDGANDFVQFTFEGITQKEATIRIFGSYGREIRKIYVPKGPDAKEKARWDGKNNDGHPMPNGIYLWTIECEGKIVCEGTTTLAR